MPHQQTALTPTSAQHFDPRQRHRRMQEAYAARDARAKELLNRFGRGLGSGLSSAFEAITTPFQWGRDRSAKDPYNIGDEGEFVGSPDEFDYAGNLPETYGIEKPNVTAERGRPRDEGMADALAGYFLPETPPARPGPWGRGLGTSPEMAYNRPGADVAPTGRGLGAPGPQYAPPVASAPPGPIQPVAMAGPGAGLAQPTPSGGVPAAIKALEDAQAIVKDPKASDKSKRNAMALIRGGLAMMAAASRPGSTALGALGVGATKGLDYLSAAGKADVAAAEKAQKEKIEKAEFGLKTAQARSLDSYRKGLIRLRRRKSGGVNKLRAEAIKAAVKGAFEKEEFSRDERSPAEKLTANLKAIGEMPEKLPSDKGNLKAGNFYKDADGNVAYFDGKRFSPLPWDEVGGDGVDDEADLGSERDSGLR